jgi:hypothetical protein
MTTRRLRLIAATVYPWLAAGSLIAAPIGRPTPPPCSAEGACTPNRASWGYSQTQWRLWPGTTIDSEGSQKQPAIGGVDIPPIQPPLPANEDLLAPPNVEGLEPVPPAEPEDEGEGPAELPPGDNADNGEQPARPAAPNTVTPPRPGFMDRAPGEVPAAQPNLPFGQPPAEGGAAPAQPNLPFGQPPANNFGPNSSREPVQGPSFGGDAPPPLPIGLNPRGNSRPTRPFAPQVVLPATAVMDQQAGGVQRAAMIPVHAPAQGGVQRAGGEVPPGLPQVFAR